MLLRILGKSISLRKSRVAIAIVAIIMGASIAGALVTTSLNVTEKVGLEFRNYGANILLVPESDSISISIGDVDYGSVTEQKFIEETDLPKIMDINWSANILGYAPYLYSVVKIENQSVVLTGIWFNETRRISPWWSLEGDWIDDKNDTTSAIIGISISEVLDIDVGDSITVTYSDLQNTTITTLVVSGIISTGGSEDSQIFVNLGLAQDISGKPGKVSTVQVSALCIACPVEVIADEIEAEITYVQAKSVQQVVQSEMQILGKLENLMLLVTLVALFASALGVMTTMTTSVMERTKEIGIMRAIGAENRKIASLFYLEALLIGVIGGFLGFVIGYILAQFIGLSVFESSMEMKIIVLPMVMALSIGITLLASTIPVRRAMAIEPAKVLRGD